MFYFKKTISNRLIITSFLFFMSLLPQLEAQEEYPYEQLQQIFTNDDYAEIAQWINLNKEKYPNWIDLYVRYAHYLLQANLYDEAIIYLEHAKALPDAQEYQISYWLGSSYAMIGDYAQALQYAKEFWYSQPNNEQALMEYIWLLYKNLQIKDALVIALEQQQVFTYSFFLHSMIALLYSDIGEYEQAVKYYELARTLHTMAGYAPELLLTNLYNQHLMELAFLNYTKAYALLEEALQINPEATHLLRSMALFYHEQMEFTLSEHYYLLAENSEIIAAQRDQSLRTPLGKIGLIDLYLDFAKLDEAYALMQEVLRQRDYYTWMRNFSVNPNFFEPLLHTQELRYWQLKQQQEKYRIVSGLRQRLIRWIKILEYGFNVRRKKVEMRRSQVNAAEYARTQLHLESILRYAGEARKGYLLLHSNILNTSEAIFMRPRDLLDVNIQKLEYQRTQLTAYSSLIDQLILPYQNRLKFSLLKDILAKARFDNKSQCNPIVWELYAYSPFFAQHSGLPIRIDLGVVENSKQVKRYLRRIHLREDSRSPYLLKLSEEKGELVARFYFNDQLLWQCQQTLDKKDSTSTYESLRLQIFSYHE